MMLIVVVVVTQYPPVVHSTNNGIDIDKVVLHDRSILVFPDFAPRRGRPNTISSSSTFVDGDFLPTIALLQMRCQA